MPLLPPISLDLGQRHPLHPDLRKRFPHIVDTEWPDDGLDLFHGQVPFGESDCYLPWHCLYFLPLPQGHGSLRPTFSPTWTGCGFPARAADGSADAPSPPVPATGSLFA